MAANRNAILTQQYDALRDRQQLITASTVARDPPGSRGSSSTELCRTAATLLFARIDGDDSPPRPVTEPTRLIVRGSGEIPTPDRRRT